jgi:hypothetical protein
LDTKDYKVFMEISEDNLEGIGWNLYLYLILTNLEFLSTR